MKKIFHPKLWMLLITLSMGCVLWSCHSNKTLPQNYGPDAVLSWNELIMKLAVEKDALLTLNGVRTEALAHTAMHNALNTITPVYEMYAYQGNQFHADPVAAVSQAAYEVAKSCFTENLTLLKQHHDRFLSQVPDGRSKDLGIQLGKETASKILELRNMDNWNAEAEYTWHPMAPGVYAGI